MKNIIIYTIFVIALFGGLFTTIGIPGYFFILTEMLIYLLLIYSFISRKGRGIFAPQAWLWFLSFIVITVLSVLLNDFRFENALYSLRLLFRFYIFFWCLTILQLHDKDLIHYTKFVSVLLLLQLPVVAIKFCIYGISERTHGAYAVHDGSLTTMIPISIIFFIAAYFFLHRQKISLLFVGFGFILFSIVGAKRAVFFLFPIQFMAIYYYIYIKGTGAQFTKKIGVFFITILVIIFVSGSVLYFSKTLNVDGRMGSSISLSYAFKFAQKYTTAEDGGGYSTGRVSTTLNIFSGLSNSGLVRLLIGFGPGSATVSMFDSIDDRRSREKLIDKLKVIYGFTTMNRIVIEYGVLGAIAFLFFILSFTKMCWKYYRIECDPYWKAFGAGSAGLSFAMLFFFLAYHWTAFWGDTMPVLYFYAMAVVYTRLNRITDEASMSLIL